MANFRNYFLAVVALVLMASTALADVRVFARSSSEGLAQFMEQLTEGGVLQGERFPSIILGHLAFDFASQNGHLERVPASNRSRESYAGLFVRWNGLGSSISVQEFQRKGQGTGFWLPIVQSGASGAATVARAVPTATTADIVNEILAARGLSETDAFTNLQQATLTEGQVRDILITEVQSGAITGQIVEEVMRETQSLMQIINDRMDRVEAVLEGQATAIETVQADLDSKADITLVEGLGADLSAALAQIERQGMAIETVQAALDNKVDAAVVEGLSVELAATSAQIERQGMAIETVQAALEDRADIAMVEGLGADLSAALAQIDGQATAIETVQADLESRADVGTVTVLAERVSALEEASKATWSWWMYAAAAAAAATVFFGVSFVTKKQAAAVAVGVEKRLDETVAAIDTRVDRLEAEAACRKQIVIPDDLERMLQALSLDAVSEVVVVVEGSEYQLRLTRTQSANDEPTVTVKGILDQREPVRIDRLRSRILRAAGKDHLNDPIVRAVA